MARLLPFAPNSEPFKSDKLLTDPKIRQAEAYRNWVAKQKAWKEERRKVMASPKPPKKTRTGLTAEEKKRLDELALRDASIKEGRR